MAASADGFDFLLKLLVLGESGVGKSNLVLRYTDDSFSDLYISTIGVDFKFKQIRLDGKNVKLQIWDTAGQERFRTITQSYYRRAHGVVVVYDVTDAKTFQHVQDWLEDIKKYAPEHIPILLVGNKVDMQSERAIDFYEAQEFAKKLGLSYKETSARTGQGVADAFAAITTQIINQIQKKSDNSRHSTTVNPAKDKKEKGDKGGCC